MNYQSPGSTELAEVLQRDLKALGNVAKEQAATEIRKLSGIDIFLSRKPRTLGREASISPLLAEKGKGIFVLLTVHFQPGAEHPVCMARNNNKHVID